MSRIENVIRRQCKQDCVYWAPLGEDGYGGKTFASAVDMLCRWEGKVQLIRLDDGNEISSRAIVYVMQDVELEGMMFLGTLDSLELDSALDSSDVADDPLSVDGAWVIKKFEKSPVLGSTTEFYRKVWLTPLLT